MTTPELKPCPFCGGHAYSDEVDEKPLFWVECRECGVNGRICPTQASAITAWNTRAAIEAATEQGKRQPLTVEQIHERYKAIRTNELRYIDIYRDAEAGHGITATPQGKI